MSDPAYRIVTPRLLLRCPQPADAPLYVAAIDASRDALAPWMPWMHPAGDLAGTVAVLQRFRAEFDTGASFPYAIFSRDEAELWGSITLHRRIGPSAYEIGYWVHSAVTRRGIATEAAGALTRVAFEVDHVARMEIHIATGNTASLGVPRKLGYTPEATLRRRIPLPGPGGATVWHDRAVWTLFADEFPASPGAALAVQAFDALGERIL